MGDRQHKSRARLTKRARDMARSGAYLNWESIEAELCAAGELPLDRSWFADAGFRFQLTKLCSLAQGPGKATVL